MKILFVSHVAEKYGAGKALLDLIDGLLQKGAKCYVIMPRQGPLTKELESRHLDYKILPFKSWVFNGRPSLKHMLCIGLNLFVSLMIVLKAFFWRADIIHSNSSVIPVGALAAFLLRKPHIWHVREFVAEHYGHSFDLGKRLTIKLMDKLSFCIIVISEALKRKYSQYIPAYKIKRIYDAVSVIHRACSLKKTEIPTLAIIGWLYPSKGQIDAILALSELIKQGIKMKLKIVGEGDLDYSNQLKRVVVQNKINKYVEFTGYMDDIALIYELADIILVCSRWEAFGRVAVESMLFKKPVIGARSGATPELIKDGFNGLLYEPGNYQELSQKIKYLIEHPEKARQMGENGFREASEKYAIAKYANEIYNVFQEAIKS